MIRKTFGLTSVLSPQKPHSFFILTPEPSISFFWSKPSRVVNRENSKKPLGVTAVTPVIAGRAAFSQRRVDYLVSM